MARESENLTVAIATGGDIPALAKALAERAKRMKDIDATLAPRETPNVAELRAALEQRVSEWREVLRKNPRQGRMILETLMGPLELERPMDPPDWAWEMMAEDLRNDAPLTWSAEAKPLAYWLERRRYVRWRPRRDSN